MFQAVSFRALTSLLSLAILMADVFADDVHIFTGPSGATLEAEVLDMRDGQVLVRRLSDGRDFQLPANGLAPQDVDFMRAWLAAREAARHPLGWKRVRVQLPEFADQVEAPGIPAAFRRIDRHLWEGELPEGAWVLVKLWREGGGDHDPQFLLPYGGEREWYLAYGNHRLTRATSPGASAGLVGVAIGGDQDEAALRAMKSELPAAGIALSAGFVDAADFAALRGAEILSLVVAKLPDFSVLREGKVRALRVTGTVVESTGLAGYEEVELLEFPQTGTFPVDTVGRLKGLRTLVADGDFRLDEGAFPALRHLSLRNCELENGGMISEFLAKLPGLQSLELPDFQELDVSGMAQCPDLTAIRLGNECFDPSSAGLGALKHLSIALLNGDYPADALAARIDSGEWSGLRALGAEGPVDLSPLPQLRQLRLRGSEDSTSLADWTGLSAVADLTIENASDTDLAALGEVAPALTGLKSLTLRFPNVIDLSGVAKLPALEWLAVSDQLMTFEQKLTALDLSPCGALRGVELARLQNLESLSLGAAALEAVLVRSCDGLTSLRGVAAESLSEVVIDNAKSLRSAPGLIDAPSLEVKRITGSPGLSR